MGNRWKKVFGKPDIQSKVIWIQNFKMRLSQNMVLDLSLLFSGPAIYGHMSLYGHTKKLNYSARDCFVDLIFAIPPYFWMRNTTMHTRTSQFHYFWLYKKTPKLSLFLLYNYSCHGNGDRATSSRGPIELKFGQWSYFLMDKNMLLGRSWLKKVDQIWITLARA